MTNGKKIAISSTINMHNLDSVVGTALHESAHCIYTDFFVLKKIANRLLEGNLMGGRRWIEMLLNFDKDIVGCIDMLFIYPNDNYKITFIQCVDYELYHEATLCMKKSHWEKYMYKETSKGEGEEEGGECTCKNC